MKHLIKVFTSWKMAVVLLTGFSCGIPPALVGGTLQAWMTDAGVELIAIGWFSTLVGIPYTFKLWAPLMDRYVPPLFGRRRGWMMISQLFLIMGLMAMAFSDPAVNLPLLAGLGVLVAFFSASQDIATDAYRTDILLKEELGAGAGLYIMGYRLAMIVSGAVALMMADHLPWNVVYLIMAGTLVIGFISTWLAPEPEMKEKRPTSLYEAIVPPLRQFFLERQGFWEVLIFILIYKADVALVNALTTPFLMHLGFLKTEIGWVSKFFGIAATIVGALVGGAYMTKLTIKKSLLYFGILQGLAGFSFYLLAHLGRNFPMFCTAVAVENFCSGLSTAAFMGFLMSLCDKRYTATQYALVSSFMAIPVRLIPGPAAMLSVSVGWEIYFIISIVIAIPGLLMLTRFDQWMKVKPLNS